MEEEIPLNELYKCVMQQKQEGEFCGIRYKHLTWQWPVVPVLTFVACSVCGAVSRSTVGSLAVLLKKESEESLCCL